MMNRRTVFFVCVCSVSVFLLGCRGTPSVPAPKFNASAIANSAMKMFDSDADGYLSKEELAASPGLLDGVRTIDKDGDEQLTAAEIVSRMEELIASKNAAQIVVCQIMQGSNQPVVDAEVTFEPEPFLADVLVAATGRTDEAGKTELACPATPLGVQPGFYRVKISKADGSIPARYNESTVLGTEVSGLSRGNEIGCYFFTLD